MSNSKKNKKSSHYNTGSFPANYSGQYTFDNFRPEKKFDDREEIVDGRIAPDYRDGHESEHSHEGEDRHDGERPYDKEHPHNGEHIPAGGRSILDSLGGIFGKRDDGGGVLKNLFSGKKIKNIFTDLDFEDLILLGVMFFLLRDGAEDELLIILAIILFTGG